MISASLCDKTDALQSLFLTPCPLRIKNFMSLKGNIFDKNDQKSDLNRQKIRKKSFSKSTLDLNDYLYDIIFHP